MEEVDWVGAPLRHALAPAVVAVLACRHFSFASSLGGCSS
jgi:hypothetical protein